MGRTLDPEKVMSPKKTAFEVRAMDEKNMGSCL